MRSQTAEVEERFANLAERTKQAEFQIAELGEPFLAMAEPANKRAKASGNGKVRRGVSWQRRSNS